MSEQPVTTEEVRDQRLDGCPVRPLGHRHGIYYFLSPIGELRPMKASDFTINGLSSLFEGDNSWLEAHFGRVDRKGKSLDGYSVYEATACLMRGCRDQGLFDSGMPVRGVGVWRGPGNDDGRAPLIVHCGDVLMINGEWQAAGQRLGNAIYPSAPRIQRVADTAASVDDAQFLLRTINRWRFQRPDLDPLLIFGFIGQAMLGGAPRWRAHMYVTGQKGSGKSWLADLVNQALGGAAHDITNNFTEASLRQALTGQARCLVLDESEQDDDGGGRVVQVIELLRHMSGGDGAKVLRGTSGGTAQSFQVTGCAYLSSILHVPLKPQDKSRITCIKMEPLPEKAEAATGELEADMKRVGRLSAALRRRMVDGWPRFVANFDAYRGALIARGVPSRSADQLSALLAGKEVLLSDHVPHADSIEDDVERALPLLEEVRDEEQDGEGEQCLNHLYSAITDVARGGGRVTLGQLIIEAEETNDIKAIGVYGLRFERGPPPETHRSLIVATRSVGLNKIFMGTRWANGAWVQALQFVGAKPTDKTHRFAGAPSRGYAIPEQHWPKMGGD